MAQAYSNVSLIEECDSVDSTFQISAGRPNLADDQPQWSLATRIGFRFAFVYFILYALSNSNLVKRLPGISYLGAKYIAGLHKLVPWIGSRLLRLGYPITVFPQGSGDTTYNYVEILYCVTISIIGTILWSLLDRKRMNYAKLYQWLSLALRFVLGAELLSYGAAKLIPSQMPAPDLSRLLETYGDSSPMGLLWTFMGASRPYEMFCGAVEMLGGILLFVPSLATLGALVGAAALTNVFLLNMCYDVPVKLFSFHLLLIVLFLAWPSVHGLARLLIMRRSAAPINSQPLFRNTSLNRAALVLQLLFGITVASVALTMSHANQKEMAQRPPHYGIWSVEEYSLEGAVKPPLLTDETRWRRLIFEFPNSLGVQGMTGEPSWYRLESDQAHNSITLSKWGDKNWKAEFSYREPQPDVLLLDGAIGGHHIRARMHREDESRFLLTSRGFHWINQYPYNR